MKSAWRVSHKQIKETMKERTPLELLSPNFAAGDLL
jgi:hypothetical protein